MDPMMLMTLASGLGGGGGSKSQSTANNSLAVNTTSNIGVNPLFAVSAGGPLSDLTAGSAGIGGSSSASAASSASPSQSDGSGGSGFPYGGTDPYPSSYDVDDDVAPSSGILGGVGDLLMDPLVLAGLAVGGFLLFQDGKA